MTRKHKRANTPITWYGGRFPCRPISQSEDEDILVWGTLTKVLLRRIVPHSAPDEALVELYQEAIKTNSAPQIIHLIEEQHAALFAAETRLTVKSGKRPAFLDLIDQEQAKIQQERAEAHREKFPYSYVRTGAERAQIASLLRAASALYHAKPWEIFTCSGFEFRLDAPAAKMNDCLVTMESFLFHQDVNPVLTLELTLDLEREILLEFSSLDTEPALAQEFAENAWELPTQERYPRINVYHNGVLIDPTADDLRAAQIMAEVVLSFITKHRHLSLLPEVTPVTETVALSWLAEGATVELTGPHPDLDYEPYEPSSYEFVEHDEQEQGDFEDDETNIK